MVDNKEKSPAYWTAMAWSAICRRTLVLSPETVTPRQVTGVSASRYPWWDAPAHRRRSRNPPISIIGRRRRRKRRRDCVQEGGYSTHEHFPLLEKLHRRPIHRKVPGRSLSSSAYASDNAHRRCPKSFFGLRNATRRSARRVL